MYIAPKQECEPIIVKKIEEEDKDVESRDKGRSESDTIKDLRAQLK